MVYSNLSLLLKPSTIHNTTPPLLYCVHSIHQHVFHPETEGAVLTLSKVSRASFSMLFTLCFKGSSMSCSSSLSSEYRSATLGWTHTHTTTQPMTTRVSFSYIYIHTHTHTTAHSTLTVLFSWTHTHTHTNNNNNPWQLWQFHLAQHTHTHTPQPMTTLSFIQLKWHRHRVYAEPDLCYYAGLHSKANDTNREWMQILTSVTILDYTAKQTTQTVYTDPDLLLLHWTTQQSKQHRECTQTLSSVITLHYTAQQMTQSVHRHWALLLHWTTQYSKWQTESVHRPWALLLHWTTQYSKWHRECTQTLNSVTILDYTAKQMTQTESVHRPWAPSQCCYTGPDGWRLPHPQTHQPADVAQCSRYGQGRQGHPAEGEYSSHTLHTHIRQTDISLIVLKDAKQLWRG